MEEFCAVDMLYIGFVMPVFRGCFTAPQTANKDACIRDDGESENRGMDN